MAQGIYQVSETPRTQIMIAPDALMDPPVTVVTRKNRWPTALLAHDPHGGLRCSARPNRGRSRLTVAGQHQSSETNNLCRALALGRKIIDNQLKYASSRNDHQRLISCNNAKASAVSGPPRDPWPARCAIGYFAASYSTAWPNSATIGH